MMRYDRTWMTETGKWYWIPCVWYGVSRHWTPSHPVAARRLGRRTVNRICGRLVFYKRTQYYRPLAGFDLIIQCSHIINISMQHQEHFDSLKNYTESINQHVLDCCCCCCFQDFFAWGGLKEGYWTPYKKYESQTDIIGGSKWKVVV